VADVVVPSAHMVRLVRAVPLCAATCAGVSPTGRRAAHGTLWALGDPAAGGGGALSGDVSLGSRSEAIELLCNGAVMRRWNPPRDGAQRGEREVRVALELGWGEVDREQEWSVDLAIEGGAIRGIEPRFRGHVVVAPQEQEWQRYAFSAWDQPAPDRVRCTTRTFGNPAVRTPATQGICVTLAGGGQTTSMGTINGRAVRVTLDELARGGVSGSLGGFLSAAYPSIVRSIAPPAVARSPIHIGPRHRVATGIPCASDSGTRSGRGAARFGSRRRDIDPERRLRLLHEGGGGPVHQLMV